MKCLWLAGFLAGFLAAAVKLEDPELTKSIQALFDEEAQPEAIHTIHTKLVDPFDDELSKDMKLETREADPFAELEALNPKPLAVTATKLGRLGQTTTKPKVDTDPFAELAKASKIPSMAAAVTKDVKDVTDVVVQAVSAQPAPRPVAVTAATDPVPVDEQILNKQPEPRLAKRFIAVNKSEQASLLKAAVTSFAENDVTKVNDTVGIKAAKELSNKTQHDQKNKTMTFAQQVPKETVLATQPAKAAKPAKPAMDVKTALPHKEIKEIKVKGTFLHARAPAEGSMNPMNPPTQEAPNDITTSAAPVAPKEALKEAPKAPKAPSSLAAFWTQEVPTVPTVNTKEAETTETTNVHQAPLALVQQKGQLHRGVDFTKSPEPSDSEPAEISISEPFKSLEQEDQRETQRLRNLDRHLRLKARMKVNDANALLPGSLVKLSATASTASTWAKLEAEDQKIEDTILDLDDPRRPADLRQYQQLNQMQDESMAQLEGEAVKQK